MTGDPRSGIAIYEGDRTALMRLLLLADEPDPISAYLHDGDALVMTEGGEPVGVIVMLDAGDGALECRNVAVAEHRHGHGIGRALMERAVDFARARGYRKVVVATAAADTGNLRFYQRCGFRMVSIDRDAFVPETGYPEDVIDGIAVRDKVWFDLDL